MKLTPVKYADLPVRRVNLSSELSYETRTECRNWLIISSDSLTGVQASAGEVKAKIFSNTQFIVEVMNFYGNGYYVGRYNWAVIKLSGRCSVNKSF